MAFETVARCDGLDVIPIGSSESQLHWYVARTQGGHQDYQAKTALKNRGYTVYRPIIPHKHMRRNREFGGACSMFPSYLFVLPLRQGWEALRTAPGMIYGQHALLRLNGANATIAHNDPQMIGIVQIRELEESLWTININGAPIEPRFKVGDRVQIKKGPWIDFCGEIESLDGDARIAVLLDLLGRRVRAFISASHIASLES